jgi:uncharacterized protein YcbK (DUF882 family)
MTNFAGLKYFRPDSSDNWGDPSKISRDLLLKLNAFREFIGKPIYVTSGYRAGNSSSEHSRGLAVDIVCPGIPLLQLYLAAERFDFKGIGVYPNWKYQGQIVGGLHLDVRTLHTPYGDRWLGIKDYKGQNQYLELSAQSLKLHGVI